MSNIINSTNGITQHIIDYMPGPTSTIYARNIRVNDIRLQLKTLNYYRHSIGMDRYTYELKAID